MKIVSWSWYTLESFFFLSFLNCCKKKEKEKEKEKKKNEYISNTKIPHSL
jgi:hypothetical protein